jgi:Leucine-rich repeat (LRR) protein
MDSLSLSDAGLKALPDLSELLIKKIDATWNYISVLWDEGLPRNLEELNLEGNLITTDGLLRDWPHSIQVLNLSRNHFWSLDQVMTWPTHLRVLNLSKTDLTRIDCSALPDGLEELNISHTNITQISTFPPSLKTFVAEFTRIESFPKSCPDTLEKFVFILTRKPVKMNCLPTYWGKSLKHLELNSNGLQRIPNSLPNTLEYANFSNNAIQEVPPIEKFPTGILLLHLGNNRIREVPSWFADRPKMKFTIHNNHLTVIPRLPNCLMAIQQFVGETYYRAAKKIQAAWRRQKIPPPIRTWKRMKTIKHDLLALAMCPERAGKFEDISPEWKYKYPGI